MNATMRRYLSIVILLSSVALLWANAEIVEWKAEPQSDKIILQWKTSQEDNVDKFVIQRSNDNEHFFDIGTVDARGPGYQYRFVDDKLGRAKSIFYYRLQVVNNDGSTQITDSLPVIPNISSIKRTWGSIKALFR